MEAVAGEASTIFKELGLPGGSSRPSTSSERRRSRRRRRTRPGRRQDKGLDVKADKEIGGRQVRTTISRAIDKSGDAFGDGVPPGRTTPALGTIPHSSAQTRWPLG